MLVKLEQMDCGNDPVNAVPWRLIASSVVMFVIHVLTFPSAGTNCKSKRCKFTSNEIESMDVNLLKEQDKVPMEGTKPISKGRLGSVKIVLARLTPR